MRTTCFSQEFLVLCLSSMCSFCKDLISAIYVCLHAVLINMFLELDVCLELCNRTHPNGTGKPNEERLEALHNVISLFVINGTRCQRCLMACSFFNWIWVCVVCISGDLSCRKC